MTLFFQRGYDKLDVSELHTAINSVSNYGSSTMAYTTTQTRFLWKLTSTGNQTVNLPTAIGIEGRMFVFYKVASTGTVTIDAFGSETIDGASTYTLTTQYETVTIISDGSNWLVI